MFSKVILATVILVLLATFMVYVPYWMIVSGVVLLVVLPMSEHFVW